MIKRAFGPPPDGVRFRPRLRPILASVALGLAVLSCGALLSGPAGAQQAEQAAEPPTAAPETQGYTLGVGDTVAVTVFGRPDLTGEFMIGPAATIRLPLIGSLPAAGRTLQEIEADVERRLAQVLDYEAGVTVDVVAYQPVFVIGDVITPGEHVYTPGMTALKAFAKAGGLPSLSQLPSSQAVELAIIGRELRLAQADLYALLVRRAALDAALDGASKIELPDELQAKKDSRLVAELIARETALLESDRAALEEVRALKRQQQEQLQEEIGSLVKEGKSLAAQANLVQKELRNMEALAQKGLTTNARMLDLQQMRSSIQADRHRQAAFLSRARQEQTRLESEIKEAEAAWRRERLQERVVVTADIERARTRVEGIKAELAALSELDGEQLVAGPRNLEFTIRRSDGKGMETLTASSTTPLRPGDVLVVEAGLSSDTGAQIGVLRTPQRSRNDPETLARARPVN